MHALRRLFCTALLGLSGLAVLPAHASASAPKDGVEYKTLPSPQPTDAGPRKVEVIEFFAYYCPHCYAFEPLLAEWVRKQGDAVVFKRVHVAAGAGVLPQQRMFYTLEALGLLEQYHAKAFAAMHVERIDAVTVRGGKGSGEFFELCAAARHQAEDGAARRIVARQGGADAARGAGDEDPVRMARPPGHFLSAFAFATSWSITCRVPWSSWASGGFPSAPSATMPGEVRKRPSTASIGQWVTP